MRLLYYERYRMLHSKIHWGISAALFLLSFWLLSSERLAQASGWEKMVFLWQNPLPMMWSGVLLAVGSFGISFQERSFNGAIYKGVSRIKLLLVRSCFYYLWGILLQLAAMAAVLTRYRAWSAVVELGVNVLLPRSLLYLLFVIALLTPPLLISVLIRDVFGGMALSSGLTFLIQNVLGQREGNLIGELAERFYPAAKMMNLNLWVGMDREMVQEAVLLGGC